MKKDFLPKSIKIKKNPINYKTAWDFVRGAKIPYSKMRNIRKETQSYTIFNYKNNNILHRAAFESLQVGKTAGVVICPKSHLYKLTALNWVSAMRTLKIRVFVGALLNKSTNGKVFNMLLRCKIAKTFFTMQFNLNSPNIISFFSEKNKKAAPHSCYFSKYKENFYRRQLSNKYGSYNKR